VIACAILLVATLPACGLRANKQAVRAATEAAVGRGTGGGVGAGTGGGTGAGTESGLGGTSSATGASSAGAGTSGAGAGSTSGGSGVGSAAPAGGNGGATDIGVTADSITVGNISDLGGPVPGLFAGGPNGTQSYFNYINSQGGIYGRKLKLRTADDQLQCNQNQAAYENMVGSVMGFVGSWSLYDNCGALVLGKHPDAFNVSQALTADAEKLPNTYNLAPYGEGAQSGPFVYWKGKFPSTITKVGTLVGNVPASVNAWNYQQQMMETLGYKVIYRNDFPPAQTNFTADVIQMKSKGVQFAIGTSINAPDWAIFVSEAAQQDFHPQVMTAGSAMYAAGWIEQAGGAKNTEGHWFFTTTAMFLGEDAGTVPEVALYAKWLKQAYPNFKSDLFSAASWADAALFVEALKKAGPKVTRKAVLAALGQIRAFNDNGMVPMQDVAAKQPGHCYLLLQARAGKFVKVDDPPVGFRCDGIFRPYQR